MKQKILIMDESDEVLCILTASPCSQDPGSTAKETAYQLDTINVSAMGITFYLPEVEDKIVPKIKSVLHSEFLHELDQGNHAIYGPKQFHGTVGYVNAEDKKIRIRDYEEKEYFTMIWDEKDLVILDGDHVLEPNELHKGDEVMTVCYEVEGVFNVTHILKVTDAVKHTATNPMVG